MARPKKGAEIGASSTIGVRVSDAMRETIEREATRHGRTLTDEVRTLLDEALAARGMLAEAGYGKAVSGGRGNRSRAAGR